MKMQGLESLLAHKNILLCVSASIASFRAIELANTLKKMGANVCVVMSEESKKFIAPLSFEGILHTKVLHNGSESWENQNTKYHTNDANDANNTHHTSDIDNKICAHATNASKIPHSCNHIAYAKWADICVVVPATANIIAKIAYGIADNLIVQTLLASPAPKIIAPAMNTQMFESPQIQSALAILKSYGFEIVSPRESTLACDTIGNGALAQIHEIVFGIAKIACCDVFWQNQKVIITGGGSSEQIDSVRCITNLSSGLQASYLAICLYVLGAEVVLISSKLPLTLPESIHIIQVKSHADYQNALHTQIKQATKAIKNAQNTQKTAQKKNPDSYIFLLMAAAIADFKPKATHSSKIKKSAMPESMRLELIQTQDLLTHINADNLIKVGFKAEDMSISESISNAKTMLLPQEQGGKGCDVVCLNIISSHNPFGSQHNAFEILDSEGSLTLEHNSKLQLSFEIAQFLKQKYQHKRAPHKHAP